MRVCKRIGSRFLFVMYEEEDNMVIREIKSSLISPQSFGCQQILVLTFKGEDGTHINNNGVSFMETVSLFLIDIRNYNPHILLHACIPLFISIRQWSRVIGEFVKITPSWQWMVVACLAGLQYHRDNHIIIWYWHGGGCCCCSPHVLFTEQKPHRMI